MNIKYAVAVWVVAVLRREPALAESAAEFVQMPPFHQQCSPQYQRVLQLQMEALKRLQGLARREGETLCATIESADELGVHKLIDPKMLQRLLTPEQRELLESLGLDPSKVDVREVHASAWRRSIKD